MSKVLNRTTKQFINNANTPDFPISDWIINPDMSAVAGFPNHKHWIVGPGDSVTLLDQASRDAIDLADESSRLDGVADQLEQTQTILRGFAEVVLDEINNLRDRHGLVARTLSQLKNAVRSKF